MFVKYYFVDCLGNKYIAYLTKESAEYRVPALADFGDLIDHLSGERFNNIDEILKNLEKENKERLAGVEIRWEKKLTKISYF